MSSFASRHANDSSLTFRSCHAAMRSAYAAAMRWTALVWAAVLAVGLAISQFVGAPAGSGSMQDIVVVAVGSLVVAVVSLVPGFRFRAAHGAFYAVMVSGITIRLVGTVALFLTCRYQLASSVQFVAGMTIGWYVLLTTVEVIVVSRRLPRSVTPGIQTDANRVGSIRSTP